MVAFLTKNEIYQYIWYLTININRYSMPVKSCDITIFILKKMKNKIKSKFLIIIFIISKLRCKYYFYAWYYIINKNKIGQNQNVGLNDSI